MKIGPFRIALLILLSFAAGFAGSVVASNYLAGNDSPNGLHGFVHQEFELTPVQKKALDEAERKFAMKRKSVELSLRASNVALASAMEEEHEYGPKVSQAIEGVHENMGELQKVTIAHVFQMRSILTPAQRKVFDERVGEALSVDPQ